LISTNDSKQELVVSEKALLDKLLSFNFSDTRLLHMLRDCQKWSSADVSVNFK
jgi:hypothetical protein